jgi:short-subunit dehydrogenase
MHMKDKVILITGTSGGIGSAISKHLAGLGAKMVLTSRDKTALEKLFAQIPGSVTVPGDVTKAEDRQMIVKTAVERCGRIDVLINCAGQAMFAPVEEINLEEYRSLVNLNVVAPLALMQLVIPHMRAQGGGTILNISSLASKKYIPNIAGYASTKYTLNALSLTAREELAKDNIVVSIIRPGIVDTDFGKHTPSPEPETLRRAPDGSVLPHVLSLDTVAKRVAELLQSGEAELDILEN